MASFAQRLAAKGKWDIAVAVALFRAPVIASPMTEIEQRFVQVNSDKEAEKSLKSNFELQQEKDRKQMEKRRKLEEEGKSLSELGSEMGITTDQLEDEWEKRWETAQSRYKLGQADDSADERALHRKLDRKLALIVRQKYPSSAKDYSSPWTAERCLGNLFNDSVQLTVFGNAPMACLPYRYPKPLAARLGAYGKVIFLFQAQLHELYKSLKFNDTFVDDYRWCSREESRQLLAPAYSETVKGVFIE